MKWYDFKRSEGDEWRDLSVMPAPCGPGVVEFTGCRRIFLFLPHHSACVLRRQPYLGKTDF